MFLTSAILKGHTAKAYFRVLDCVLHMAEMHDRVSARVFTTMHTDLKFLRAGETRSDNTPMRLIHGLDTRSCVYPVDNIRLFTKPFATLKPKITSIMLKIIII